MSARMAPEQNRQGPECVVCLDSVTLESGLECGHSFCEACVRRAFSLSVEDSEHMPPRCCGERLPLRLAQGLFSRQMKEQWNGAWKRHVRRNWRECPRSWCSGRVDPEQEECEQCGRKTCAKCGRRQHDGHCRESGGDAELECLAVQQGWQRCPSCGCMIEHTAGCMHMTW